RRMKIMNRHERIIAATPERIAALIADFDRIWPTQIAPAPRLHGHRLYDAGLMLWGEYDRPGAAVRSGWPGPMNCRASTGSSWGLHKAGPLCATRSRAARPGSTRRSGVSGSSRYMT